MKATEILEELEKLVAQPFDPAEFAFQFIECFPQSSKTTLARLRKGSSNKSDVPGAILQRNNIHILAAQTGEVEAGLRTLKDSPQTAKQKVKFILATDGETLQAENIKSGAFIACDFVDLPDKHFGFLLPLAGISTNKEILDNPFDIKATSRLDRLYQELAANNPDWTTPERREDFNHFMAQLIFCFYAEDTSIFQLHGVGLVDDQRPKTYAGLFTETVRERSNADGTGTQKAIRAIFEAMNIDTRDGKSSARLDAGLPGWADNFPYVNGGLFGTEDDKKLDVPHFTQMARSYLIAAGELKWTDINPDIFGSMIQAVADDEERGSLGMHYTSVPNILKVLNPLFLNSLEEQLERAGDNPQQLGKLRKRMAHIRVFDPACGSGNFLVIAYKKMREIEQLSNIFSGRADWVGEGTPDLKRLRYLFNGGETSREELVKALKDWSGQPSEISLRNFFGIEIKPFAAEVARLALIIAEYQCDEIYIGQKQADIRFLPLDKQNWIVRGNALQLDWLGICPPAGKREVKVQNWALDLEGGEAKQKEIAFENEGGETYICGNPPYKGSKKQTSIEKQDLHAAWEGISDISKRVDFVSGWIAKFIAYFKAAPSTASLVVTNSICQGQQASDIWPEVFKSGISIQFAHLPFKWQNLAQKNAGVTVVVIGLGEQKNQALLFDEDVTLKCDTIGPYLVPNQLGLVVKAMKPLTEVYEMSFGNMPRDGGNLFLSLEEALALRSTDTVATKYVYKFLGSSEAIKGIERRCIWIEDDQVEDARTSNFIQERLESVAKNRCQSSAASTRDFAQYPHRFVQIAGRAKNHSIVVPRVSSENREYLPATIANGKTIIGDRNFALYDAPLWNMALIVSRLHWVWIGTVCVRMRTDFSYSNTLGWNTFPVPQLTLEQRSDLTESAENILLAREAFFPATIADLYKPASNGHAGMPERLRAAHTENDRILEEIYIGRPFKNDTERLASLFEMYQVLTQKVPI